MKLDYEKAYDMVDWVYLDVILEQKGFSQMVFGLFIYSKFLYYDKW